MNNVDKILLSGKPQLNRKINASLVFSLLQKEGPLSRADLAKRTNIRSTSISAIVQQLLEENLVREVGRGQSTGGRHPILLEINPAGLYAAGIEIAEDCLNGVIVNLAGKVLSNETIDIADTKIETVSETADKLLDRLSETSRVERNQLAGVGLAVPGIISRDAGSVVLSQALNWKNVPLKQLLSEKLGLDIHVLNNAMAGALGEYFGGMGQGVRSLLYVLIYLQHVREKELTGLGCGIVLDGRAYFGEGHVAGEVRADIEHPLVTARKLMGDKAPSDIAKLVQETEKDPDVYAPVWDQFAEHMAEAMKWGMDFLSPGRVIVGTDIPEVGEFVSERMLTVLRDSTITGLLTEMSVLSEQVGVKVHFSPLRADTLARGAIVPRLQELSLAPLLRESVLS